ncbi:MAG: hypothetical protein ABJB10_13335 [Mesorhizobium sp.]
MPAPGALIHEKSNSYGEAVNLNQLVQEDIFDINVDISPAPRIVILEEKWRE